MSEIVDWRKLGLKSLDLILCAGNSKMSKRIQKFQRFTGAPEEYAKFSHVARVMLFCGNCDTLVQESTTLNRYSNQKGVQMDSMEDWLPNYDGEVYVRKLEFERTEESGFYIKDIEFWFDHKNDDYENGIPGALELLLCGLRLHRAVRWAFPDYTPKFTSEPHCTELDALAIDAHRKWNTVGGSCRPFPPPFNRMPPWMWAKEIDKWLACPIGKLIQIKG